MQPNSGQRITQQIEKMKRNSVIALIFSLFPLSPLLAQRAVTMGIDELFGMIGRNNKTMIVMRSDTEAASEDMAAARKSRLPDITTKLSASYIGNALMTNRHFGDAQGLKSPHFGNSFSLQVRQTLYAGGVVNANIKLSELQHRQTQINSEATSQQLRLAALQEYLDLYKTDNRMKVLRENIALTEILIANIKEKHANGVALKNDVTRYELQLQTLNLQLTEAENIRSILNHRLCNTVGLENTVITPDSTVGNSSFAKDGETAWQSIAAVSSPSVLIADNEKKIASQRLKMAKSDMLPKISVVAADEFNGPITFELPPVDKNINTWYIGVGVSYNLSSLFKGNRKVSAARTRQRIADEKKAVALETLNNDMQQAYTEYLQSYVELDTRLKSAQLANDNYAVVNKRYLNQLALITDMIDASNTKLDAELKVADARVNIALCYYKMKFIAGKL